MAMVFVQVAISTLVDRGCRTERATYPPKPDLSDGIRLSDHHQ